jgi:ATP-dependent Clp protease ATP-binding subunit ClpA
MIEQRLSIFEKYAKVLLPCDNNKNPLLEEHPQIPLLVDTLSRHQNHHLLLVKSSADLFNETMVETLAQALSALPGLLQNAHGIYFDVAAFMLSEETVDDIENDFRILCNDIRMNNKRIVFVINQLPTEGLGILEILWKKLKSILMNDQWRLIVLTSPVDQSVYLDKSFFKELFTTIQIAEPSEKESIAILKQYRIELENFHHVIISEEILPSALSLASTYFSGQSILDKAWELLDIAATRLNTSPQLEQKPIMSSAHLAQVVSYWTKIPLTHLQNNKFQMARLVEALQQNIFGQDRAIQNITTILQNACLRLHKKTGPLCSFMLAGPSSVGKASLVYSLAEQLFGHHEAVLRVNLNNMIHRLENVVVNTGLNAEHSTDLFSAIQQTPYAILFFENVEQFSEEMHAIVKSILAYGYLHEGKKKYDFRHAIIAISTTVGSDRIIQLVQSAPEQHKQIDLMQLVLNEHVHEPAHQHVLQDNISEQIIPELTMHFSNELLQYTNLIPFLPLNYMALEKVIRNILQLLKKRLNVMFGIELHYAPEVIKFLTHEALWQRSHIKSLDKLLEYSLYSCISSAILMQVEDRANSLKRLVLQLNDNGQLLRCEFMTTAEPALYHL